SPYGAGAVRIYEHSGLDVTDEWPHLETAPVRIRSNCSSHGQTISAGLFLSDSPWMVTPVLQLEIAINQFWPLDSRFNFDNPAVRIKVQHSVQTSDVDQQAVGVELLASHCMPSTCNRDRPSIFSGSAND